MNVKKQFKDGLITQNPVLVQLLGMCSTMAITTSMFNGIGMGLSVLIILTCCNIVISALRKVIPNDIRIAIYVVVIAGFVTIVDLMLQAYIPALASALDGIFQGIGYTIVLVAMCVIREFLGQGTFGGGFIDVANGFRITLDGTGGGIQLMPAEFGALAMILPFGGFLTLGVLIAAVQYFMRKSEEKKAKKEAVK